MTKDKHKLNLEANLALLVVHKQKFMVMVMVMAVHDALWMEQKTGI